ncbi:MAG: hypothetical protein LBO80_10475 [Treponema sp.]|jgi:hypothetical protein|nr:hypothetical protein [Treponema sp.]
MFSFFNRTGNTGSPRAAPLSPPLVLGLAAAAALFFSGCDTGGINSPYIPELYTPSNSVASVWVCDYGNSDPSDDWYIAITDTTYTEYMPSMLDGSTDMNGDNLNTGKDAITYSAKVVEITGISQPAGWIYVELDDDYDFDSGSDEYVAIRWESYGGTSIKLGSGLSNGEDIRSSLDDIKTAKDSYDTSSWTDFETYAKVNVRVPLKGDLTDSAWGGTVEITGITYTDIYSYGGSSGVTYSGVIVGTTDPFQSEGYIYIKYAVNAAFPEGSIAGNYYAIHWKNHTLGSIDLSGSSNGSGKPTLDAARVAYTTANGYFSTYTAFTK